MILALSQHIAALSVNSLSPALGFDRLPRPACHAIPTTHMPMMLRLDPPLSRSGHECQDV